MSVNLNRNTLKTTLSKIVRGIQYNPFEAEVIVIGGGGRGGVVSNTTDTGNGGGAGSFISASYTFLPTSSYFIQVGEGGSGSLSGSTFTFFQSEPSKISLGSTGSIIEDLFIAPGGGNGSSKPETYTYVPSFDAYGNGGSPGGRKNWNPGNNYQPFSVVPATIPSGSVLGYPRTGSLSQVAPQEGGALLTFAGGGGVNGTGSLGQSGDTAATRGLGIGFNETFLNGIRTNGPASRGGGILLGASENGNANTGQGGGLIGGSGIVAIKYFGEPKMTGGEIFEEEDYTIHVFTASVDITTTGKTYGGSDVDRPLPIIQTTATIAAGGGGGGVPSASFTNGGGGGAGAIVSSSFTLGRNVTYTIVVGEGGNSGSNGGDTYIYGFDDTSSAYYSSGSTPFSMSADGGYAGVRYDTDNPSNTGKGGNSGQGYIYRGDDVTYFPSYSGGQGGFNLGGGGASVIRDGEDGINGGRGVFGVTNTQLDIYKTPIGLNVWPVGNGGNAQPSFNGVNLLTQGSGGDFNTNGQNGAIVLQWNQYWDREDIVLTGNYTASVGGGFRYYQFGPGTSSITLNYNPTGST